MTGKSAKEIKELFAKHSKDRITIIKRTKNERKQIKSSLRSAGFTDIVEIDEYDDAWDKLHLATTSVLVFSLANPEGIDFLENLIESTRFRSTALVIFTNKPTEHPKIFANAQINAVWAEAPMNTLKVEQALVKSLELGAPEKSLVADASVSLAHYSDAMKAMSSGDNEEARECLRKSLKENPDFFEAYEKMAETLIALGEYDAAKRVLARAATIRKDDPKVLLLLAKLGIETESKENAKRIFDNSIEKRPKDAMLIIDIGNLAMNKGWMDYAIHYFEKARLIDPNMIHVYNRLGIAYSRERRFEDAMGMYEKALKIDVEDAGIHFNIGMTHYRMKENEQAILYFKKAEELDPDMPEPKEWREKLESAK